MVQELLQKKGLEPPVYQTQKQGKDNAPIFYTRVEALGEVASGQGGSKKQAEQDAAQKLYQQLSKR
jgi:dsRNA-specific ribonuclease